MAKYVIENEKFVIRPIEEKDKEQAKALLKENKYLKRLWSLDKMKDIADSVIESVFMDSDSTYCIFEYSDAKVHPFRKFRAPFSGKAEHTFPE